MKRLFLFLAISACQGNLVSAELTPAERKFFESNVRPLLLKHCHECHSAEHKIKGGLRLDNREAWMEGGDSGPVITQRKPQDSLLIESVHYENSDLQMPPKYKLEPEDIAILEQWIALGAPDPRTGGEEDMETGPLSEEELEQGRKHWSFQPVIPEVPPAIKDRKWPRDELDHFILSRIEKADISPAPDADRFTLIRRISFDLTGLPPLHPLKPRRTGAPIKTLE